MNFVRVLAVAHKEWHEILRDRIYFLLAFILPPLLMLVFCYGISQDVENVPFAVVDRSLSAPARVWTRIGPPAMVGVPLELVFVQPNGMPEDETVKSASKIV